MLYKHLSISIWDEARNEPNSFHVDCELREEFTFEQLMERIIKPAVHCAFGKLIPEMPHVGSHGKRRDRQLQNLMEWEDRYFRRSDA